MKNFRKSLTVAIYLLPAIASAASFSSIVDSIKSQLGTIPGLLIGLAVIYFLWGVLKYIMAGGEGEVAEATQMIIWGLVAIFVMVAVNGLVAVVGGTFGVSGGGSLTPPTLP